MPATEVETHRSANNGGRSLEPAIRVQDLERMYVHQQGLLRRTQRRIVALDGISLQVQPGEVFGLVGPNGAGKTTLIKILTTLLLPTSGSAYVMGFDVSRDERAIRRRVNFVLGGEQGLYWRLSGEDNLQFFSDLQRVPHQIAKQRVPALLHLVGLWDRRRDTVERYSKGMKQRLQIARALVNDPDVLFLDEPTLGLDPAAARQLRDVVGELHVRGKTIFITSHYMAEMEVMCDRIAVLKKGKLVATDTPQALKSLIREQSVVEAQTLRDVQAVAQELKELPFVSAVSVSSIGQAHTLRVLTDDAPATCAVIARALDGEGLGRLIERAPNLEDAYLKLVGDGL